MASNESSATSHRPVCRALELQSGVGEKLLSYGHTLSWSSVFVAQTNTSAVLIELKWRSPHSFTSTPAPESHTHTHTRTSVITCEAAALSPATPFKYLHNSKGVAFHFKLHYGR